MIVYMYYLILWHNLVHTHTHTHTHTRHDIIYMF